MDYNVYSGQIYNGVVLEYDDMTVHSGGVTTNVTVNEGGNLNVITGGSALNVVWTPFVGKVNICDSNGYDYPGDGPVTLSFSGGGQGVFLGSGGILVSSAMTMTGKVLSNNDDDYYSGSWEMYVMNGGTATDTLANDPGVVYVFTGGTANSTTVGLDGGYYNTNGNSLHVACGGVANATTVNPDGYMYVYDGGVANSTVLAGGRDKYKARLYIYDGGAVYDTVVYRFCSTFAEGGKMSRTLITGEEARVYVESGVADDTVVKNDAEFSVSNGGVATSAVVKNNGEICVWNGGNLKSASASDYGTIYVFGGGSADEIAVGNCGELHVARGGTATMVRENGGSVEIMGGAYVTFAENSFSGFVVSSGMMTVHSGTVANATTVENGELAVYDGGITNSTTVENGVANFYLGAKVTGALTIAAGAAVTAHEGSVIDFDISTVAAENAARVNDLSLVAGTPDFTVTVSATQKSGTYRLAGGAAGFDKTVTVTTDAGAQLGTVNVGATLVSGGHTYSLAENSGTLSLTIDGGARRLAADDLNGDGFADIVMTIAQAGHGAYGATGAWLIQGNQTAVWGDLSTRNSGWEIFGTGATVAGKNTNDVYVKSADNIVGAWTTGDDGKITGWTTVESFDSNTQVLGLGDFNGDGQSDLLLRNTNGAVGCHLTDGTGWNYFQSLGDEWTVTTVGDLNGDGRDDVVLKHDAGFAGSWLTQADCTMAWANLDTLQAGFAIVGTGDFDGDGTSDVLLKNGTYYGAWLVQNGSAAGWFGLGDLGGVTVEQIADFDADGRDDLRIKTAAGDLGTLLVKGADNLEWKYYGSVGAEWSTSLAAI